MGNLTRVDSSSTNNAAALAAQREERLRQLAEAARRAAEAARRAAEEAQAKLKDALQKPTPNPKEVATLRDAATKLQAKADAAEKLAVQREAQVPKTASTRTLTGQNDAFVPCVDTSAVAASNEAKFVTAAAQNGNGVEALVSGLAKNPDDASYTGTLIAQSREAVENDLKNQLQNDPTRGKEQVKRYLEALPADQRAAALESLKPALLANVQRQAQANPAAAAKELRELVEQLPDPVSRKALIDGARESITQMIASASSSGGREQNAELLRELATAGKLAGPDGMKSLTDAVAQSWPTYSAAWVKRDLTLSNPLALANFDNQQQNPADALPFTESLVKSLDEVGKTDVAQGLRESHEAAQGTSVMLSTSKFETAKANVEANNQRLQEELKRLGKSLTEAQKQQYIKDFNNQPQVKADVEALDKAAKDVAAVIEQVATSPESTPAMIQKAADVAKELAKSPIGAIEAKNFAVKLRERLETEPGLVEDVEAMKTQLDKTIEDSAVNVYTELLRKSGGNVDEANKNFAAQFEFLEQNRNVFSNLQPLKKAVDAISAGNLAALREISSDQKFGKTFKSLGVMFSIAKLGSMSSDPNDPAYADARSFIKETANAGKEGLEVLAEAMKNSGELFKNAKAVDGMKSAGSLVERFTPGLALVANSISLQMDVVKLNSRNGNWGDLVSLIGNSAATLGSALELTGVGVPVGKLLQTVGSIAAGVGGLISMVQAEGQITDEMKRLLEKQPELEGLTDKLADGELKRLAEKTEMTPEQVQRFMRENPELLKNPVNLKRFVDVAEATGVKGEKVHGLGEVVKKNPDLLPYIGSNVAPGVIRTMIRQWPDARELLDGKR
ncbi:MAG: hypothetical protein JNK82_41210 [Myxococcaceae bacterium]|nr:hypothetical protein [Myxococcaceae bacterium]